MFIKNYLKSYLSYLKDIRKYSIHTIRNYKLSINQVLQLSEIEEDNNFYILNITKYRIVSIKKAKRTIYANISRIKNFIDYLNNFKNINIKLKGAQTIKLPKTLPKPLKKEDIFRVVEKESQDIRLIIKLFYGLGLRISELCNIKLSDFNEEFLRVIGKGQKTRDIPIPKALQQEIKEYIKITSLNNFLFEKNGLAYKPSQIRYIINKTFKKYGIKATPHQLRHSFATDLLENGARIADVSELLGHSFLSTTQIYTKLNTSIKLQNYIKAHPLAKKN